MPQAGLDGLRVDPGGDQQAGVRVAGRVEGTVRQARRCQVALPGAVYIVWIDRTADLGAKDVILLGIIAHRKRQQGLHHCRREVERPPGVPGLERGLADYVAVTVADAAEVPPDLEQTLTEVEIAPS